MPGPGRHLNARRRLASKQRAGTVSRQRVYRPPSRPVRAPTSHGPSRGPSVTPTGGGVKAGSGVTPVGRKTRRVDRTVARIERRIAASPSHTTNLNQARSRLHDLHAAESASERVRKAMHSSGGLSAPFDPNEAASLVKKVGGSKAEARALSTKVLGESGGNPKAVGHDPGGTTGLGLWQLTTGVGNDALINKYGGPKAMLKPKPNAKAALDLYRSSGIGSWYAPSNAPGTPRPVGKKPKPKDIAKIAKVGAPLPGKKPKKAASPPKPKQLTRFKAIKKAAKTLTRGDVPYVWGGGHGSLTDPVTGLDCSGAVSRVLHAAGVLDRPLTSGQMGEVVKPGPGAVTVYYNSGHTFMKIGNKYWGTSVGDSGSGGLGPHPKPTASYLADYQVGHVPGLGKKAAASLGVKLGEPGGTTSTSFSGGGGSVQAGPGFSNSPITVAGKKVLEAAAKKKLKKVKHFAGKTPVPNLSAKIKAARAHRTSGGRSEDPISAALRKKYGKPAV